MGSEEMIWSEERGEICWRKLMRKNCSQLKEVMCVVMEWRSGSNDGWKGVYL